MGATDWPDGEWCGPVSVRELRSGWRFLLRKRSSLHEFFFGNHRYRCYRDAHVAVCVAFDKISHSHSLRDRFLKWIAIFHRSRSIYEKSSFSFSRNCPTTNPWIRCVRDRLLDYSTRLHIPRVFSPIWTFLARTEKRVTHNDGHSMNDPVLRQRGNPWTSSSDPIKAE